jgi:methionyl-tRNA formyltransferase
MGKIDFNKDAVSIRNLIRGLNPWPSAYTHISGKTLKVWDSKVLDENGFEAYLSNCREKADLSDRAAKYGVGSILAVSKDSFVVNTGKDYLEITEVQLEGKKRMSVKDFLLGNKISVGEELI